MSHRFGSLTLRNVLFQLHWLLGVSAGVVLALVGVTGAMLSFEDEALAALNPGIITVVPRGPADFRQYHAAEVETWGRIIREIKLDTGRAEPPTQADTTLPNPAPGR